MHLNRLILFTNLVVKQTYFEFPYSAHFYLKPSLHGLKKFMKKEFKSIYRPYNKKMVKKKK